MRKILDYLFLPITLWIATAIRFTPTTFDLREIYLLATSFIAWYIATNALRYYANQKRRGNLTYRFSVVLLFFFIMTGFSFYTQKELDFSRVILVLFTTFQYLLPSFTHLILSKLGLLPHKKYNSLLIGHGALFETVQEEYRRSDKLFTVHQIEEIQTGTFSTILKTEQEQNNIQEVVILLETLNKTINDTLISLCHEQGVRCQIIYHNTHISSLPLSSESHDNRTYFRPLANRLELRDNRIAKRLFDFFGSLFIIAILSPLFALLALLIKLYDHKGPILFVQNRTGYNQKKFSCYKFRSMKVIPQAEADKIQATQNDPRITYLGHILRKTNLDELPQLFNVLKGEMSLVGPRPHPVVMDSLTQQVPEYLLRHFVTPGMTGWAQVNGWRGETDTDEKIEKRVEFDLWYVEHWSLGLDIKIMWMTIFSKKSYKNAG